MKGDHVIWQGSPSWLGFVPRSWKWILSYLLFIFFLFLLQLVGILSFILFLLVCFVLIALVVAYAHFRIKTTVYTITQKRVNEKYGIINVQKEQAHIGNITNITVNKNLVERLLRIGRLDVDTANSSANILDWWGLADVDRVENIINDLRLDLEDDSSAGT
jgi:uncharacterized membrane protein YdbT with pleckstrin-like domain